MRAAAGTMGSVGQALQATSCIPIHPGVQALAGDPPPLGHLGHCPPVTNHLHDGVIALLDHSILPEHPPHPPRPGRPGRQRPGKARRSVKDHPKPCQASAEPLSSINRTHNVKDQPQPHKAARGIAADNLLTGPALNLCWDGCARPSCGAFSMAQIWAWTRLRSATPGTAACPPTVNLRIRTIAELERLLQSSSSILSC
jgi:hypothetical protein